MNLDQAGAYMGVSSWIIREWINAGDLPVVEARRPRTASALKHRPQSEALRRLLIDRADLDALADSFTKVRR
jgi:predicted site-specific integrase-resolvase